MCSAMPSSMCWPAGAHGAREIGQHRHRHLPAHARVGDALSVAERGRVLQLLTPIDEEALHHHAEDRVLAVGDLLGEIVRGDGLTAKVLVTVAVARVHHESRSLSGVDERGRGLLHADRVVVRPARPAAQDDVTVRVAARGDDRAEPLLGHAQELMRMRGGAHGVDRDLHAAVGAVLEADRHREARCELAVHLALGRPRADGAPGDEVRGELRRDRIEELAARRQPELGKIEQDPARATQTLVDHEAPVEVRIVDEPLPADRRARFLEVDAHDDAEVGHVLVGQDPQAAAVLECGARIVDGARPDDHDEPIVLAPQDPADVPARPRHGLRAALVERLLLEQDRRR